MFKDKITQKIDNLLVYSYFLPEDTKADFIKDLNKIKAEIVSNIETNSEITQNENPSEDLEKPAGKVNAPVKAFTPPVIVKEDQKKSKGAKFLESHPDNLKTETNPENVSNIFNYIIPNFSFESKVLLSLSNSQNLSRLVNIIDEQASLLNIYDKHKDNFKNSKFEFLKLIHKLDAQELLTYKKNDVLNERVARVKFGELAISLGLVNREQVEETFTYKLQNPDKQLFIGNSLVELNYMDIETLNYCLKIQDWCNKILANVSNENAFIDAIRDVLENYFKLPAVLGKFTNITYEEPLTKTICVTYEFTGKLNGYVYYICDRSLVEKLTKILMTNYGMSPNDVDKIVIEEKILSKLFNLITGNSLAKLSKNGIYCKPGLLKIDLGNEITLSKEKSLSILPISTEFGRFTIGFLLNE